MSGKSIIENMIMNISPTVTSRLNLKELKKDLYYSLVGHVHEAARYILNVSSDLDCHLSHNEAAWSELRSVATIFIKIPIENLPEVRLVFSYSYYYFLILNFGLAWSCKWLWKD